MPQSASELFSLQGKTALVTGGAQGLGRMIAEGLISAGARVYITSRKPEICESAAAELAQQGDCRALPGDAGDPEGMRNIAQRFRDAEGGALHLLVNNAGKTWGAPIESFPDKAWTSVMGVNVQGPFTAVQALLPELSAGASATDPARVINIGSIAGIKTTPLQAYSYGASKAALHFLTKQLASDLVARHITVNAIAPGYFPTSMTAHLKDDPDAGLEKQVPMRRLGTPEDIVGAIVFLSSRAGAYVTGAVLPVDGGMVGAS